MSCRKIVKALAVVWRIHNHLKKKQIKNRFTVRNSNSNCYKILHVFGTILIFQIQQKQKCPATRKLVLSVFRMLMVRSSTSVLQIYKKAPPSCCILIIPLWICRVEVKFIACVPVTAQKFEYKCEV